MGSTALLFATFTLGSIKKNTVVITIVFCDLRVFLLYVDKIVPIYLLPCVDLTPEIHNLPSSLALLAFLYLFTPCPICIVCLLGLIPC